MASRHHRCPQGAYVLSSFLTSALTRRAEFIKFSDTGKGAKAASAETVGVAPVASTAMEVDA